MVLLLSTSRLLTHNEQVVKLLQVWQLAMLQLYTQVLLEVRENGLAHDTQIVL